MATPFLGVNYRSGTPKVKRYANSSPGDPVPGEVTFGVADTAQNHSLVKNRVVQFGMNKQWFCAVGTAIHYTTDAGLTWSSAAPFGVPTIASINAATHLKSGLHVIDIGGVPHLVMFYQTTLASTWRAYKFNGSVWTNHGPFTVTTGGITCFIDEVVFNNVLYIMGSTLTNIASFIAFYDPGADSAGDFTHHVNGNVNPSSFAPYRGSLYGIAKGLGTADVTLRDYTTGIGTLVRATLFVGSVGSGAGSRFAEGFVDPATGDLICMFYGTTLTGWQATRVSPAITLTPINVVIPTGMTGTTVGGNAPSNSRCRVFVDQEATPGANPDIYVYYAPDGIPGSPMTMFKWNGVATPMSVVDSGGNGADALGTNADMDGGQYSWSSGEKTLQYSQWLPTPGGIRVTFKLYSDSGTDLVRIRVFTRRNLAPQDRTKTPAELTLPSVGTLSGTGPGNYMEGPAVVADNGVTTYQVTVNLAGVGFSLVERGRVVFDVVDP